MSEQTCQGLEERATRSAGRIALHSRCAAHACRGPCLPDIQSSHTTKTQQWRSSKEEGSETHSTAKKVGKNKKTKNKTETESNPSFPSPLVLSLIPRPPPPRCSLPRAPPGDGSPGPRVIRPLQQLAVEQVAALQSTRGCRDRDAGAETQGQRRRGRDRSRQASTHTHTHTRKTSGMVL